MTCVVLLYPFPTLSTVQYSSTVPEKQYSTKMLRARKLRSSETVKLSTSSPVTNSNSSSCESRVFVFGLSFGAVLFDRDHKMTVQYLALCISPPNSMQRGNLIHARQCLHTDLKEPQTREMKPVVKYFVPQIKGISSTKIFILFSVTF